MLNKDTLIEVMEHVKRLGITELVITHDRVEIRTVSHSASRDTRVQATPEPSALGTPIVKPVVEEPVGEILEVKAPLPGTIYVAPATDEDGKPLPKVGDSVDENTVIALVEAMKMFNQIYAPGKGVIKNIMLPNQSSVKTTDLIMTIEKTG
ncbi:MAG: hypothetical protein GX811_07075 [Lentisphaerae bacterium]|nr:hypothetical protein [Lentisphaerota bacterium]